MPAGSLGSPAAAGGRLGAPSPFDPRVFAAMPGLEWKARYVMEGFLSGLHGSPFHGPSLEFRDYRDYQPGDDLRRIDWRLYARNDRLCVRRYEQETNARCYLLCDTSASMSYRGAAAWASKIEAARVLALALSFLLLRQDDAVGLLALEGGGKGPRLTEQPPRVRYVRPSQKPDQAGVMLRELGNLHPQGGPALAALLDHAGRIAHRRSLLVLISDLLEPSAEVELGLKRLRFGGHECLCLQVLDGDEIDFPFQDATLFEDVESGLRRRVAGREVGDLYRTRFTAFLGEWQDLFRRLEMRHLVVRTDRDPAATLARFFAGAKGTA